MPNVQFSLPLPIYLRLIDRCQMLACSPDQVAKYITLLGIDTELEKLYEQQVRSRRARR